jgi:hypothetical protein
MRNKQRSNSIKDYFTSIDLSERVQEWRKLKQHSRSKRKNRARSGAYLDISKSFISLFTVFLTFLSYVSRFAITLPHIFLNCYHKSNIFGLCVGFIAMSYDLVDKWTFPLHFAFPSNASRLWSLFTDLFWADPGTFLCPFCSSQ